MNLPDIVAICASSPQQAQSFSAAIERRQAAGIYPRELEFRVVHDPEGGRVGSGGGTLHALQSLPADASTLLIHAGGESRRLPAWAPEGKLFAPVPVASSTVQPPVLLDIQLGLYLRYPWRPGELVVAAGDVYLDFDVASIRRDRGEVCGFAVPASLDEGSRHGVFVFDELRRNVVGYYQKASVERLKRDAALPGGESCALDIGIVAFDRAGRLRLEALTERFGKRVEAGEVYIDLYVEILTAALSGIDDGTYESLIADRSRLTVEDRGAIREVMRDAGLQGILGRKSTFLHYGSVSEVPDTAFRLATSDGILPFYDVADGAGLIHEMRPSLVGNTVLSDCEDVTVHDGTATDRPSLIDSCHNIEVTPAGGNLVSGVIHASVPSALPVGFCLDGRSGDGEYVAVYHSTDSFKPAGDDNLPLMCGEPLDQWFVRRGLGPVTTNAVSIWDVPLWPILPRYSGERASAALRGRYIAAFWDAALVDDSWREWFRATPRRTLHELNELSELTRREEVRSARRARILRKTILSNSGWQSLPAAEATSVFFPEDRVVLQQMIEAEPDELIRAYRTRVLREVPATQSASDGADVIHAHSIQVPYLSSLTRPPVLRRSVKPDQIVWARSPVRMDFGGGLVGRMRDLLADASSVDRYAAVYAA